MSDKTKSNENMTDEELMKNFQDKGLKDLRAYELLFNRHHKDLIGWFCKRKVPHPDYDHLATEVFLRIYKCAVKHNDEKDKHNDEKGKYNEEIGVFKTWMYKIASNIHIDYLRREKARRKRMMEAPISLSEYDFDNMVVESTQKERKTETTLIAEEQFSIVEKYVQDNMTPLRVEIFSGIRAGIAAKEIAEYASRPYGTVRWNTHEMRNKLRKAFPSLAK